MHTFVVFIDEQRKNQSKLENKKDFNVLVLFGQYIDWVLAKQEVAAKDKNKTTPPHQMTAVELLFQLKIINTYLSYVKYQMYDGELPELPEVPEHIKKEEIKEKFSYRIYSIDNALSSQAESCYKAGKITRFANGMILSAVTAVLLTVFLGIFGGATLAIATPVPVLVFVGFNFLAVAKLKCSEMLGDKKAREQAFDKASDSVFTFVGFNFLAIPAIERSEFQGEKKAREQAFGKANLASIAIRQAVLDDRFFNGSEFELTLNATTSVMLKSWKGAYATQTTAPAAIDLKQVKVELDKAKAAQKVAA